MTRGRPLVEARGRGKWILEGVDLAVPVGEDITLIGPNGAGRTTLVRVLLGLLKPDAGTVRRDAAAILFLGSLASGPLARTFR